MSNTFGVIFNRNQPYVMTQSESLSNGCSFTVQDSCTSVIECMESKMRSQKKGYTYLYPTKNAHQAEVLNRLLQKVQKFQLFCWVQYVFNKVCEDGRPIQEYHKKMLQYLTFINSSNSYASYNYISGRNYPIKVYELDTNRENLKPCFFVREYEIHDNMGPLYMYVMLVINNLNLPKISFYDFDVRFIGSDEPLTEYISKIPIYDATQIYQQKRDEYTTANQEYINQICQLIGSQKFRKALQTYTQGMECDNFKNPSECFAYNSTTGMCIGNCMWKNIITHDGGGAYKLFCETFGNEIGKLVKNGEFTHDKWHLMPDFTNRTFVDAYNNFCLSNGLGYYRIQNIFDPDLYMFKAFQYLNKYIERIETWGEKPDGNIVPCPYKGYIFDIPTNESSNIQMAGITRRAIKDYTAPHK